MKHKFTGVRILLTILLAAFFVFNTFSQEGDSSVLSRSDSIGRNPHGSAVHLIIGEVLMAGLSYYAASPNVHGDRVIGWTYTGLSGVFALVGPVYWLAVKKKNNPDNKRDALAHLATFWGMSYGFYRIGSYNLWKADGHPGWKRFARNFLEMHAAYIVPLCAHALVEKHFFKGKKPSKFNTGFTIGPGGASVVVRWK